MVSEILIKAARLSLKRKSNSPLSKKKKWNDAAVNALKKSLNSIKVKLKTDKFNRYLISRYTQLKRKYRKLVRLKNKEFKASMLKKISEISNQNPRAMWNVVKKLRAKKQQNIPITLEEFKEYYQSLLNTKSEHTANPKLKQYLKSLLAKRTQDSIFDEEISFKELKQATDKLKARVASGEDLISSEMIKNSINSCAPTFLKLFNHILNCETIPTQWGLGYMTPIPKSGDLSEVNNYRGLTVSSCLSKLFFHIVNNRIITFLDKNSKISEFKIGFKSGCRTSDHIFVLKTLIDVYKKRQKKLYACFVDLRKAYDSVWHPGLFIKLLKIGISPKIIRLIQDLYSKSKTCIKLDNKLSDYFQVSLGVRQGCVLSPILFNIYINGLVRSLSNVCSSPAVLGHLKVPILMYADDIILLSESPVGLQNSMNSLQLYCKTWKLRVNTSKTKVIIFNSRSSAGYNFKIGQHAIEMVKQYCYLGVTVHQSGNFKMAWEILVNKGAKAYAALHNVFNIYHGCPVKIMLKLIEALVEPVMLYCCEIWGGYMVKKMTNLENLFFNFSLPFQKLFIRMCKQILGVRKNSCNVSVMAELGVYPPVLKILRQVFKYVLRLLNCKKNSLLGEALQQQKQLWQTGGNSYLNMVKLINSSLNIKISSDVISSDMTLLKTKIKVQSDKMFDKLKIKYTEAVNNKIRSLPKMSLYCTLKKNYGFESYLSNISNPKNISNPNLRKSVTKFRLSAHTLPIELGRYKNITRDQRCCNLCNLCNVIGDEQHYVLYCKNSKITQARLSCSQELLKRSHYLKN